MATKYRGDLEAGKSPRTLLGQLVKWCVACGLDNTIVAMLNILSLKILRDRRARLQHIVKWLGINGVCTYGCV